MLGTIVSFNTSEAKGEKKVVQEAGTFLEQILTHVLESLGREFKDCGRGCARIKPSFTSTGNLIAVRFLGMNFSRTELAGSLRENMTKEIIQ